MCQLKQKVKFKVPLRTENADLNTLTFSLTHILTLDVKGQNKWEEVRAGERETDVRGFHRALITLTIVLCADTQLYKGVFTHTHLYP